MIRRTLISGILTWIAATTLLSGAPLAKEIPATCYLFSFFLGNGEDGLHLAWSRDGLKTWKDVSAELSMPKGIRHGTAFEVPGEVVRTLLEQ